MISLLRCPLAAVGMAVDALLTARVARRGALCVDVFASPQQVLADMEAEIDAWEPLDPSPAPPGSVGGDGSPADSGNPPPPAGEHPTP